MAPMSGDLVPYRTPTLVVDAPPPRISVWRRFRNWWRGIGWGIEINVTVQSVEIKVTNPSPGSLDTKIQVSWAALMQLEALVDQTQDGDPVYFRYINKYGDERDEVFQANCVPKLRREVHETCRVYRLSRDVQGWK